MAKFISPNLRLLVNHHRANVIEREPEGGGVSLEGSSRSMKTWSSVDFIIYLCAKIETNCTINIIKETYSSFKTTLSQTVVSFPISTDGKLLNNRFLLFSRIIFLI